jgi:hypothetical protein
MLSSSTSDGNATIMVMVVMVTMQTLCSEPDVGSTSRQESSQTHERLSGLSLDGIETRAMGR